VPTVRESRGDSVITTKASAPSDEAFHIERRGIDHVEEGERWATPAGLFGMWAGAIVNFEILIYGAVLMSFGFDFIQAVIAIVLGNLTYVLVGLASLQGPDTGTTTFTINRAAFGPNGNRGVALFNWLTQVGFETEGIALIVLAGLALAAKAGVHPSTPLKIVLIVAAAAIQLVLPLLGHATILKTLRVLLVPFVAGFIVLAALTLGKARVNDYIHGASWQTFMAGLAFVIIVSGLGWTENGNDYSRYIPRGASRKAIVGWVFAGTALPSILLMLLGAAVASYVPNAGGNPVANFPLAFPGWFLVPFLLVSIVQVFSINSLDLYSSGLTLQALGLRVARWQAVLIDTVVCCGLTAYAIFDSSFNKLLTDFVDCVIVWIGPWTAIFLVDWWLRRYRYVPSELQRTDEGLYWRIGGVHWPAVIALVLGMVAAVMALDTTFFVSPISSATGGADFSVFMGLFVGGVAYYLLAAREVRKEVLIQDELRRFIARSTGVEDEDL
jgi:purine-cytosine permease-like protein